MQHMTAANGVAVHHGYDGLRQSSDLHLHIQHIEPWHSVGTDISSTSLDVHVTTRAESLVAGACEYDNPYR